jgi:anti-anti-sigma regulatory factor
MEGQVMVMNHGASSQAIVVELPPRLDTKSAVGLKTQLFEVLNQVGPIMINADAVNRMSTATCQLIVAFVLAARARQRVVSFEQPSLSFKSAFEVLGLTSFISGEM